MVLRQQLDVAKLVAPLLSHTSLEVVIETARVFGNLSQVSAGCVELHLWVDTSQSCFDYGCVELHPWIDTSQLL